MKKYLISTLVVSVIALSACTEKDKTYYLEHLDQAQEKKSECKNKKALAWKNRDTNSLRALNRDDECNAAIEAIIENNKKHNNLECTTMQCKELNTENLTPQQELELENWERRKALLGPFN